MEYVSAVLANPWVDLLCELKKYKIENTSLKKQLEIKL